MRRWVLIGGAVFALFVVVGVVVTFSAKVRAASNLKVCQFNLQHVALFAAHHAHPPPDLPQDKLRHEVPAGTVVLMGVPPDERLSWVVAVLPGLDQKRTPAAAVLAAIDQSQPWPAEGNQQAARTRLASFLCPGNPPEAVPDQPAPTQYVGIAGLGPDAATLALPSPRAGCFRYDAPTPFEAITDGLSQSLLFGERSGDVGPWLRGGPATLRGLDDAPGATLLIAVGGQFGGNHLGVANWAFADGSVRTLTDRIDPKVLYGLATIAGQKRDPLPGE
jgi:prepilin-type processing-associated H-X9-DG protein